MVPIIKKCRRVGYKGLILLSDPVSDKKKVQSCDKKICRYQLHLLKSKRLRVE